MSQLEESKIVEHCYRLGLTEEQTEKLKSDGPTSRRVLGYKIFEITDGEITRAEIARNLGIHYNTVNEMCKKRCPEKIRKRKWVGEADNFYKANSDKSYVITKTGKFYLENLIDIHEHFGTDENHRICFLKKIQRPKSLEKIKQDYGCRGIQKVRIFLNQNILKEYNKKD